MRYLWIYLKELFKLFFGWIIISGILLYFLMNTVTLIIVFLLFIGIFFGAFDAVKKRKTLESKKELEKNLDRETFNYFSNSKNSENIDNESTNLKNEKSIFEDIELD